MIYQSFLFCRFMYSAVFRSVVLSFIRTLSPSQSSELKLILRLTEKESPLWTTDFFFFNLPKILCLKLQECEDLITAFLCHMVLQTKYH